MIRRKRNTISKFNRTFNTIMESIKPIKKHTLIKEDSEDDEDQQLEQIRTKYFNTKWFTDTYELKKFIKENKENVLQLHYFWFKRTLTNALQDPHILNLWGIQPKKFKNGEITIGQLFSLGFDARNGIYWNPNQLNNIVTEKVGDKVDTVMTKFKEILKNDHNILRINTLTDEICKIFKEVKIIPDKFLK